MDTLLLAELARAAERHAGDFNPRRQSRVYLFVLWSPGFDDQRLDLTVISVPGRILSGLILLTSLSGVISGLILLTFNQRLDLTVTSIPFRIVVARVL